MQNRIMTSARYLMAAAVALPISAASGQEFFIANGDSAALIAAINDANADPAPATIHLASNGNYVLTSVQHGSSSTGTPQMTSEITINGNGSTVMRSFATGTPDFRIFIASSAAEVTINDLTITNGLNRQGAGIYNDGMMTLNNVTVTANEGPSGGGIANTGPLTLIDCVVTDNREASNGGGGIFSQGANADLTIIGSVISGNTAASSSGGGVRNQPSATATGGLLTIIDSVISNNSAMGVNGHGGGISNSGYVTISGTTISGNETSGTGGGISSTRTLDIVDSVIADNSANNGGGVYNSIGQVTITGGEITGNSADSLGGGLHHTGTSTGSTMALSGVFVSGNSADRGGGIFTRRPMTIEDSLIEDNIADADGGGIAHDNNSLQLLRSTVRDNAAGTNGGGLSNGSGGSVTVEQSTISGNHADGDGGGIHIYGLNFGRTELINSTVSGNSALGHGGGISNFKSGAEVLVLVNSTVYANSANEGGGIRNTGWQSGVQISNSIVAGSTGGDIVGLYVDVIYNIVQDGVGLTNPTSMSGDPTLGPLEDNGGPTLTHAPAFNSIAVDAGDCSVSAGGNISPVSEDQRGEERPKGSACDIGSVEYFCAPDINGDGVVDADDFFEFLSLFAAGDARADFNGDGVIDADDFFAFLSAFAAGC
ncbi:MAG: hypothetical protein JJU33_01020 [Phycisphaerales bacterium]|nr:hypothetical protein [Phycisphaerales bacterium]